MSKSGRAKATSRARQRNSASSSVRFGLISESLASIVNRKLIAKSKPSTLAVKIVGKASGKRFNLMMSKAVESYNNNHDTKIFDE